MFKTHEPPEDADGPPDCRATVDRLQAVLDGDAPPEALETDHHLLVCTTCRERTGAARALLAVLARPAVPTAVPADFSVRVVTALRAERHARTRRGVYRAAAGLAVAATVLLAVFVVIARAPNRDTANHQPASQGPTTEPSSAPAVREDAPAPEARPIHLNEAVAHTEEAIRGAPRPIMESVSAAPKVFDLLTGPLKMPAHPTDPVTAALAPTRKSLAELPGAARAGLEPVTGTAEKAFARFLSDVGSIKPNS
ncbi:zf-HC2 domain-containing protein [Frigoriglobus tundricola]|uniref:Zinc-finger domain-containing protein n=1 Tax=Frigoriglobus tundricola TaxID=2774151 RepID=A0A6M5YFS5_9BACT|nr:zf-HC2 domain-containing protein [Frigoriglobus tundricola]QJW92867.1 hypothetical protein FTUN_0364 [Frigoriglobus tundricola]